MCRPRRAVLLLVGLLAAATALAWRGLPVRPLVMLPAPAEARTDLEGQVVDAQGPVAGARVRWQGSSRAVVTDATGAFRLPPRPPGASGRITAWKEGYLIAGTSPEEQPVRLELRPLPASDCEAYAWVDPTPDPARPHQCGNCHPQIHAEWAASGHAHAATNRRFLNLYDGSDWQGRRGVGWSLLAEHPDGVGVCTACHAPALPVRDPAYFDLRKVQGTAARGVHCDYCHKVADTAGEQIGLTHGRFGLKLLRPAEGQLFFGPLEDVDRGEDAAAPLYRESRYCASCHEGTVFGVHVYSTYSEWLESPARRAGQQCQDCHMAPTGTLTNLAPGRGGIDRDPWTLSSHRLPGGDRNMLRRCLRVRLRFTASADAVQAEVEVSAEGVGHRVPTGFSDRNLVLVVEPQGADGSRLPAREGPTLPALAGSEVAGLPGVLIAKQLAGFEGEQPAPFWRARPEAVDTRLRPGEVSRSRFTLPGGTATVRLRLLYRRFWPAVARAKGWPDNEITLVDETLTVAAGLEASWPAAAVAFPSSPGSVSPARSSGPLKSLRPVSDIPQ